MSSEKLLQVNPGDWVTWKDAKQAVDMVEEYGSGPFLVSSAKNFHSPSLSPPWSTFSVSLKKQDGSRVADRHDGTAAEFSTGWFKKCSAPDV
ncbi:MAG: hypothetical protein HYT27_00835 [Parcubacteria group bacterium]|nr:hypothetical protein [Parcubacteria group bacterium]